MRKLPFLVLLSLLVVAACGRSKAPFDDEEQLNALQSWMGNFGGSPQTGIDVEALELPPLQTQGRYDEIFNDSNYVQYAFAERLGISPIHNLADAYNTRRPLVKIESCSNYHVDSLTHSMPYLVPEAAALLDDIGKAFSDSVEKYYGTRDNKIIVTSLLRSHYTVKKLRRVNRNAVDSSTHMFATTFDIAYNKFHCSDSSKAVDGARLKDLLAKVLLEKRKEGRCLVKYEKKSPCFHITVAR